MLISRALSNALLGLFALGCGGAQAAPGGASTPAAAAEEGPAYACLRVAEAKRERRADEPARVSLKHVLVQHAFSKKGRDSIKRSREEACLRAAEARDKLRAGADFADVAREYSDEPGAASRGGSIGAVERSDLVPAFADAAFELDVRQLSDVVETEFGFHVILRTE